MRAALLSLAVAMAVAAPLLLATGHQWPAWGAVLAALLLAGFAPPRRPGATIAVRRPPGGEEAP